MCVLFICFLQTCLLLGVNVIGQRMDFYAMLHAFALIAVMYKRRRKAIAEIWPKYCCFLACMLTFQYFVCIGIPPAACKGLCNRLTWCSNYSADLSNNLIYKCQKLLEVIITSSQSSQNYNIYLTLKLSLSFYTFSGFIWDHVKACPLVMVHVFISDYPWRFPNSTTDSNVVKWLYVPDFKTKPNSSFLICMCSSVAP